MMLHCFCWDMQVTSTKSKIGFDTCTYAGCRSMDRFGWMLAEIYHGPNCSKLLWEQSAAADLHAFCDKRQHRHLLGQNWMINSSLTRQPCRLSHDWVGAILPKICVHVLALHGTCIKCSLKGELTTPYLWQIKHDARKWMISLLKFCHWIPIWTQLCILNINNKFSRKQLLSSIDISLARSISVVPGITGMKANQYMIVLGLSSVFCSLLLIVEILEPFHLPETKCLTCQK